MISMMMFLMLLFVGKQIQERPIDAVHHDTYSVAALADGMAYYQTQAIQKCWHEVVTVRFASSLVHGQPVIFHF